MTLTRRDALGLLAGNLMSKKFDPGESDLPNHASWRRAPLDELDRVLELARVTDVLEHLLEGAGDIG